jgi:hypothetical protein
MIFLVMPLAVVYNYKLSGDSLHKMQPHERGLKKILV